MAQNSKFYALNRRSASMQREEIARTLSKFTKFDAQDDGFGCSLAKPVITLR
jgi:hypothetical protein